MIPPEDAAYARGWYEGEQSGREIGRRQARGQIVAGILARAQAAEQAAGTAPTVNLQAASRSVAAWLRGLADEVKRGEL